MDEPEAKSEKKRERGYSSVAMRELRRARRAVEQATDTTTLPPEAAMAIQIANVLALLDVADALRGRTAGGPTDE